MFRSFVRPSLMSAVKQHMERLQLCHVKNFTDRGPQEKGINQVILMGRCGSDAQLKGSQNTPVVVFSLATNAHYKPLSSENEQFVQKTEWHRISVFKQRLQQKTLDYAKKGSRLYVQGRLSYGEITDTNGVSHQTTSIVADDIIFLSSVRSSTDNEEESESMRR